MRTARYLGIEHAMLADVTTSTHASRVLVVGAGPVGLCMAIGLRRRGIACTVVERHATTLDFPKGRLVSVRTMEVLREWGLARAVEAAGLPRDESLFIFSGTSLLAPEFSRVGLANQETVDPLSPEQRLLCDQMAMEAVLLDAARALGADVRFSTELTGFDQDEDGVTAMLAGADGADTQVRAEWMVAADGARSGVRAALGVDRAGPGRHGRGVSIYFRAPLGERMVGRTAGRYDLAAIPNASVMVVDNDERWLIICASDPSTESPDQFDDAWALELIHRAIGDPTVPVEVVGVRVWESFALVADRYQVGRTFLVGDAAHVTTPIGGLGMNCGVADVHNLAWKLGAVLDGWAELSLLGTYEAERRPVGLATVEASTGAARPPAPASGAVLGAAYVSDAVAPDGTEPPIVADAVNDYVPTARPGHRAPHLWMDADTDRSTLDLFGDQFVVLAGPAAQAAAEAQVRAASAAGIPVRVVAIEGDRWQEAYGVGSAGAVVVRPDGHVAARSRDVGAAGTDLGAQLLRACGRVPGS